MTKKIVVPQQVLLSDSGGKVRRKVGAYIPYVLQPRGALTRPPWANPSIEIFGEQQGQFPVVHITADAHGKMRALVASCPVEILWLSPTKVTDSGDVVIYDVLVPHQVCTGGSTQKLVTKDFDGEDHLLSELMTERKFDMIRDLICWGHSHVNFSTFASGVDEDQTRYYLKSMTEMGKTRFVRLIANKGDDLFASLYLLDEGKAYHHAPIKAEPSDTKKWEAWAQEQVAKKVTIPKPQKQHRNPVYLIGDGTYGQFLTSPNFAKDSSVHNQGSKAIWPWPQQPLAIHPINALDNNNEGSNND